jgi:hypothetical protein
MVIKMFNFFYNGENYPKGQIQAAKFSQVFGLIKVENEGYIILE